MLARCLNPNHHARRNYSVRGIRVCREWQKSFLAFYEHIGPRPSRRHSLERIRNNEGYKPGNVKWATRKEQANNKRNNRMVIYRGSRMTLMQAIKKSKNSLTFQAIMYRLDAGWPTNHALEAAKYDRP